MKTIDDQIRNALSNEDAEMIGGPNDGLRLDQLLISTFQSRNRFITIMMMLVSFVFLGLSIWCAVRFFGAEDTKELLTWGFGFIIGIFAVSFMKIWFWLEMQRIAITREVKKVELLAARLLQEMATKSSD